MQKNETLQTGLVSQHLLTIQFACIASRRRLKYRSFSIDLFSSERTWMLIQWNVKTCGYKKKEEKQSSEKSNPGQTEYSEHQLEKKYGDSRTSL